VNVPEERKERKERKKERKERRKERRKESNINVRTFQQHTLKHTSHPTPTHHTPRTTHHIPHTIYHVALLSSPLLSFPFL
jgi:hypothetical protein